MMEVREAKKLGRKMTWIGISYRNSNSFNASIMMIFTLFELSLLASAVSAFCYEDPRLPVVTPQRNNDVRIPCHSVAMVGGRGWDNQDYLSSLSGDDDDRENEKEKYQDFSERRAAFQKRQEDLLKNSPQAQAFLQQRQRQQQENLMQEGKSMQDNFGFQNFEDDEIETGSGGGTRMGQMMAQAKRMQSSRNSPMKGGPAMPGFQQKLAVPLDHDEGHDEEDHE
jgi:hypothetical protein